VRVNDSQTSEIRQLEARIATLEQLLDVYERSVIEQSDRLYAEQERLRLQTTLLRHQGEASLDGILSSSTEGRILFANRRLAEMWGIAPPTIGAAEFAATLSAMAEKSADPDGFRRASEDVTNTGETRSEVELLDGRTFDYYSAPIHDAAEGVLGRLLQFRDISAFKEIDRLKDEFVAAVSHELRTPLTSVRGGLDLMASGVMGEIPHEAMSLVKIAQSNCRRLVRLINDVLDIEKIEAGRMDYRLEPIGLEAFLQESIESMRPYGVERGIEFSLEGRAPGAWIHADRDRLSQVMENLLSNAAKFSPVGGTVRVSAERLGSKLRVSVADRGPGIAPELHFRVFEKFAQIATTGASRAEGTGLGLNIARAIVERHGGSIGVESTPGQGSRFYFDLEEWRLGDDSGGAR
jgi:signal transduction histidine kinase